MPTEVILPKVDMDMESGTISAWHVADGDTVDQGDPLFDIETDKAAMEVESPASGTLHHIIAGKGKTVPIGQTVAWIYTDGEEVPDAPPETLESKATDAPIADAPLAKSAREPAEPASSNEAQRATPAARKLAKDSGIPLDDIPGTGPRDRVQRSDVQALLETRSPIIDPSLTEIKWAAEVTQLNILRTGSGDGTPWLLIHGLGADATAWAFIEEDLATNAPVLKLELPCHGKSPLLKMESFAHLATLVRKSVDDLGLDRLRLVGHSLGGALAIALADTRPRMIESVTLLSPAGLGPQINGNILSGMTRATTSASLGPWLREMVGDPAQMTDNFVQAAMMTRKDPALRQAQQHMQNVVFPDSTQSFDLTAALHRLICPTRIIFGKRDQVIPWQHALKAPGSVSLNLFPDMGHIPQFEDPESVLRHL